MSRFNDLYALFAELRRLKQEEMVEAERISDPIARAAAEINARESIEWVERMIEKVMKRE